MGENTKIAWCHHSFNPFVGCQKVGPGCDNCYAEGWAKRSGLVKWGPGTERRRTSAANWKQPLKWNRQAQIQVDAWERFKATNQGLTDEQLIAQGFVKPERPRVFSASLADVFDNAAPDEWRRDLFALIHATPYLDWLLCTKRIGNVMAMLPQDWGDGYVNVWLGITVCDQAEADRDIPKLMQIPAKVRWLSMEPLLGPVDLGKYLDPDIGSVRCPSCGKDDGTSDDVGGTCPGCGSVRGWNRDYGFMFDSEKPAQIDWIVVGCESGPHARLMPLEYARSLRDQSKNTKVAFFMKQLHDERGKAIADMAQFTSDLQIREYPKVCHA